MIEIRRDAEIYEIDGGWFRARWHFSFDRYRDPNNDGFGALRVFNDDRLAPGAVWPMHPHKDIEGLTVVLEGSFGHEDNIGGAPGPLPPGSVQRMTLGSGAYHSEQNASPDEPMRFLQMWILPDRAGLPPGVEQKIFTREDRTNRLLRVFSPEGGDAVKVHADASVYLARLEPGAGATHEIGTDRGVYLYVVEGVISLANDELATGDAAKITGEDEIAVVARETAELVLVDVPMVFTPVGVWARG